MTNLQGREKSILWVIASLAYFVIFLVIATNSKVVLYPTTM